MASHDLSHEARMKAAREGKALQDGSYPIRDRTELARAISAFGRAPAAHRSALRALIRRRARELGATDLLGPALST
jgi:hypothetical protein